MIFHIDLDAFYASVEIRDNPSLKDKVVLICGKSERSVITTCNYNARKYGIHSAMPLFKALELYPNPVAIKPRMSYYKEISNKVMAIFYRFTDKVYQLSIDEAFLDFTDAKRLYKSAKDLATQIKDKIFKEVGITCSIGISNSFYVSKMASGFRKPNGITIVKDDKTLEFIDTIGIDHLWGFGRKSKELFHRKAIYNTKIAREYCKEDLIRILGKHVGNFLYHSVRGLDYINFTSEAKSKSISKEITLRNNSCDKDLLFTTLLQLCKETYFEAIDKGYNIKSIGIKIKYSDFSVITKQTSAPIYLNLDALYEIVKNLFLDKWNRSTVRLVGVSLNDLSKGKLQATFFDINEKKSKLDKLAMNMEKKGQVLTKAALIKK